MSDNDRSKALRDEKNELLEARRVMKKETDI